jgi:hypothetical protein
MRSGAWPLGAGVAGTGKWLGYSEPVRVPDEAGLQELDAQTGESAAGRLRSRSR